MISWEVAYFEKWDAVPFRRGKIFQQNVILFVPRIQISSTYPVDMHRSILNIAILVWRSVSERVLNMHSVDGFVHNTGFRVKHQDINASEKTPH